MDCIRELSWTSPGACGRLGVCRSGVFRNSSSLCLNVARAAAQASVRHVPALVQRKNVGTVRRAATAGV